MATESLKIERVPRGSNPPYLHLAEAFELAKGVYEQGGGTVSYDLMSQLTGNSTSSSSFNRKLAALRWYGLATDQEKAVILSEIGNAIAAPQTPEAAAEAKKAAFLNIEVFARVYDRHKGKLLPADEFLKNIIEQDCKIPRELSPAWVTAFKDASEAAGLLMQRADGKTQILESAIKHPSAIPASRSTTIAEMPRQRGSSASDYVSPTNSLSASGHSSKIELADGRFAEFRIPDRLTPRDAQRIKKALVGYEALLESMIFDDGADKSKNGNSSE